MKKYYKLMLGQGSVHADECHRDNFVGVDFGIQVDLTGKLSDDWRQFNREFIPKFLANHPGKSKVAAGLACGALHTVAWGFSDGDILLCPDGTGSYLVGEVAGQYSYHAGGILPHRRPVKWYQGTGIIYFMRAG